MKVTLVFLLFFCAAAYGAKIQGKNVIDVPDNCPEGQKPDANGKCREEWPDFLMSYNVIDVPNNCPEGEAPDANGKCRPIWPMSLEDPTPRNPASASPVCPSGQILDRNGKCRPLMQFILSFLKLLSG